MKVQWQVSIAKEGRWMGPLAAFVLGTTAFFSSLLLSARADEVLLFDSRGSPVPSYVTIPELPHVAKVSLHW
jgi:hypothetical protein